MAALTLEAAFWCSLAAIVWTYAGYPALLMLLAKFTPDPDPGTKIEPSVTVIITAYNEERTLATKLEDTLQLDYPKDRLQVLVASDCSDDDTDAIAHSFEERGVELLALPERGGKTAAQNTAVRQAQGDILVFTDASTKFHAQTIHRLVAAFSDERVGCAGAELDYVSLEGTQVGQGAGAYWRYEKYVKSLESRVHSLIGVSGCLYAVRRSAYSEIAPDMISDLVIASEVYTKGYRTIYAPEAVAYETTHESTGREFAMRVRIAVRSINGLLRYWKLLNPFQYGLFSVQLFSHKVLRYLVPELLLILMILNPVLAFGDVTERARFYQWLLWPHGLIYVMAIAGWLSQSIGIRVPGLHIPFYFLQVNLAAFWAFVLFLFGERKTIWTPVR